VPLLDAKADAAALELIRTMLTDKVNASVVADLEAAWAATLPSPPATETRACRCAACADVPLGAALCSPWGELLPCACTNSSEARQGFPMSLPDRPCCRDASDTSCAACEVVAGYDGLEPAALSEALGSRAAGKFALAVSGTAPLTALMTFLTVRPRAAANPRLPRADRNSRARVRTRSCTKVSLSSSQASPNHPASVTSSRIEASSPVSMPRSR